jgi:WD40 repeat protein
MSPPIVEMHKASQESPRQKFEGHTDSVYGALHLPDGQRMVTCSEDGSLRVWNIKSGKQIGDDWRDGESGVYTIALSPDGKKVVSGGEDCGVRLWDVDTGKVIAKWFGHTKPVWSVCWSGDGQRVLSGSNDGTVREWDVENGETIFAPVQTGHTDVYAAVYSPDMTMFATGGNNGSPNPGYDKSPVKIWDAKTGELVATLKGHTHSAMCLAWSSDGKMLISGSSDHSIRTWDTTSWKQIRVVLEAHISGVFAIAISPNGRILASTSFDNTAQLWNLDNNQPISSFLLHAETVFFASFSADGKLLATSCNDDNAYTWDVCAIVKEAGLDDLLLDKSVLAVRDTFINGSHRI